MHARIRTIHSATLDREVEVRRARPEDAAELVRLAEACYVGTYCVPEALDENALARDLETERVWVAVAERRGQIFAQSALIRHRDRVDEVGRVMLDAAMRRESSSTVEGVVRRLNTVVTQEWTQTRRTRVMFASAVGRQPQGQAMCLRFGAQPVGLTFGLYPKWQVQGVEPAQTRAAALWFVWRFTDDFEAVGLDEKWARRLGVFFAAAQIPIVRRALDDRNRDSLRWRRYHSDAMQMESLTATSQSEGLTLSQALGSCNSDTATLVEVPLNHPRSCAALDELEEAGFIPGALLPEKDSETGGHVIQMSRAPTPEMLSERLKLVPASMAFVKLAYPEVFEQLNVHDVATRARSSPPVPHPAPTF